MTYSRWQIADSKRLRSLWGFTLIELLISVSIIAILISIAVVQYSSVNQRSRDGKRKADLEQIRSAIEVYRVDCGQYPPSITFGSSSLNGTGVGSCSSSSYMSPVPQDPLGTAKNYTYYYNRTGNTTYRLCAILELGRTGTDQDCTGSPDCETGTGTTACDFGLTEP